jgi:hypothetical protein
MADDKVSQLEEGHRKKKQHIDFWIGRKEGQVIL